MAEYLLSYEESDELSREEGINSVVSFLRQRLEGGVSDNIGLSDAINAYAKEEDITFELSRDRLCNSIDSGKVKLTSVYRVNLSE